MFVGLIMQYHYVGFDTIPVSGSNEVPPSTTGVATDHYHDVQPKSNVATPAEALDDEEMSVDGSRSFTASQARDKNAMSKYVCQDKAYSFMKNIRGSPPYYQRKFNDLLAMIRQLGTPAWLFKPSAADLKWPDMIAKQHGVLYTDEEVAALSLILMTNPIGSRAIL